MSVIITEEELIPGREAAYLNIRIEQTAAFVTVLALIIVQYWV